MNTMRGHVTVSGTTADRKILNRSKGKRKTEETKRGRTSGEEEEEEEEEDYIDRTYTTRTVGLTREYPLDFVLLQVNYIWKNRTEKNKASHSPLPSVKFRKVIFRRETNALEEEEEKDEEEEEEEEGKS